MKEGRKEGRKEGVSCLIEDLCSYGIQRSILDEYALLQLGIT